jgi:hypothetical protein
MSKRTINLSKLDKIIYGLRNNKKLFKLTAVDKFIGRSELDVSDDGKKTYLLRKLEYADFILLERVIFTEEAELDDYIFMYLFDKGNYLEDFKTQITK